MRSAGTGDAAIVIEETNVAIAMLDTRAQKTQQLQATHVRQAQGSLSVGMARTVIGIREAIAGSSIPKDECTNGRNKAREMAGLR